MRFFKDTQGIRKRAARPHGRVPKDNDYTEMYANAQEYAEKLSKHPEVIGVTLTGGLSRGYGDELSEIDLNIYMTPEACREWSIGKGPIPHGDHMGNKYHMDVSFLDYSRESGKDWGLPKKWDASYAKILYDPEKKIKALLDSKDVFTAEDKYGLALGNYLDCVYFGGIVVRQWSLRDDPLVANQMISKAIPSLCNLLFLANDEYPPFEKWLINYSYNLQWKPEEWEKKLNEITLIKEITFDEATRRSRLLLSLYHTVWARIVGEEQRDTGLLELDALETLEYVIQKTPTVEEFASRYSPDQLGYEVLYKLAEIETQDGEERIVFNREKFIQEKEEGFPSFLDWNKEMLHHVRDV